MMSEALNEHLAKLCVTYGHDWGYGDDDVRCTDCGADAALVPVTGIYLVTDGAVRAVSSVTPSGAVRCAYVEFEREGE